jgi:tetratricopeptide (TPR) repeat protein
VQTYCNPQSLDALNGEAAVYQARGQFPEAQKDIEKAIKIDPQDADSRFDLGQLFAIEGHYADAEREIQRSTALDPSRMPGGTRWIAYMVLGHLHQNLGDYFGAAQEYRAALNVRPKNPETIVSVAIAVAHEASTLHGDQRARYRQEANKEFLSAVAERPTSSIIQRAYGLFRNR